MEPQLASAALAASPAELYFTALQAAFAEAQARTQAREYTLAVGPAALRLAFAGVELTRGVLPALAHVIPGAPAEATATVCVWDSESTGVDVPPFTWRPRHLGHQGQIDGYNDERFRTIYHGDIFAPDGGFDALSMFDAEQRTAIFWVASRHHVHWWERAEPLRTLLHWVLDAEDRYLAHAAAVGDDDGVVLLVGRGGMGKTTTTLACLRDGLRFVGDNYVLLSLEDEPFAHGLYSNAKLRPGTLELMPELADAVNTLDVKEEGEKFIVDVKRWRPEQVVTGMPVRALVVPHVIGDGATRMVEASPMEGLLALAPTTVCQLPENGGVLAAMARLVRELPTYKLELGGDVAGGPAAIRSLLHRLRR
jgi:hypothetical protein